MFILVVALSVLTQDAQAQFYFGKNKVQYSNFDWQVMTTKHFRVYFYENEATVARVAARLAEESYRDLAANYRHEVKRKIPLIIYSSPSFFTQTNVIPGMLPESVGGFTEFMKGRVVVPFNGRYADFAHVIRHELVHAFMLSRLDEVYSRRNRIRPYGPPLWFTEGLAEYWSKKWDNESDMTVRDMVVNDRMFSISRMYQIRGTFFMYKLGESILHFIDSAYGPDKVPRLFDNWHKAKSFDRLVELTLGDNLKELSRKWEYYLKKKYYPQLDDWGLPKMESRQLTEDGFSEKGVPITWDDGDGAREYVVYKGYRLGYLGIYMIPVDAREKQRRTLLKGGLSSDFESLHLLRSGIDANDDGLIVFSSKSKANDVLYIYDLKEGRVSRRYEFSDLAEARSPRLSRDGDKIVFSGVTSAGFTNIYLLDQESGDYVALTNDMYHDADPTFDYDGERVVFSSDRCAGGAEGALNLFEVDLDGRATKQLTYGPYQDQTPDCSSSGIYFSSDRDGAFNLYRLNEGVLTQLSQYATGAFDPRLEADGEHIVYTGYQDMSYQVYRMKLPEETPVIARAEPERPERWQPERVDQKHGRTAIKYDTDYSLDIAQSTVGYDPVHGSLGGVQLALSDMLGNRAYYLLLTNTARTKDEFLQSFNIGVTYVNRERRLNWGLGVFHLYDEYYNDFDKYYFERQAGGLALLSYPISKFQRVDLTSVFRYSNRESRYRFNDREAFLVTNYLSWVYDNTVWDISGPIDGRRYNFTLGMTTALDRARMFNRLAMADVRHYYRLGRFSALANRLFAYSSGGEEPQRIYLGGSWSFRGHARHAFYNRKVLFSSTELRFPLIDLLLIGFPFGGMDFRGIRGALFFDAGSAWDDEFDQFQGSYGAGFRVALGYVVQLRFDFTRTTDFHTISPGTDFDLFFGWNF